MLKKQINLWVPCKIKELPKKFLLDRHSTWSFIKTQKLDFWRQIKGQFKRRISHVPNLIPILVD